MDLESMGSGWQTLYLFGRLSNKTKQKQKQNKPRNIRKTEMTLFPTLNPYPHSQGGTKPHVEP